MKKPIIHISTLAALCILTMDAGAAEVGVLSNLNPYTNATLKSIRDDIRQAVYVVKSRRPERELPALRFYSYRVQKDDTFWTILARTSQDIDTLLSVNGFSTPKDVAPGRTIYIPNMRGVIMKGNDGKAIARMLSDNLIRPEYVYRANRCSDLNKKHLFIPGGKISNLERSLFLGTGFMSPLQQRRSPRLTSSFGMRRSPFNQRYYEFHSGVDVSCPRGSEVLAARDGKVAFTGFAGGYGNLVVLRHEYGYSSLYGHLARPTVRVGDKVKRGAVVGISGNTGRTTGPHLHFEVRRGRMAVHPGVLLAD